MRPVAPLALLTAALVIAGCGGGGSAPHGRAGAAGSQSIATTSQTSATSGQSIATPGPTAAAGVRSFAGVAACLRARDIPAAPYSRPRGIAAKATASAPRVLLVMPWHAIAITVYGAPVASRSAITVKDAGAVMARGNVALALDRIPKPPATTLRTIESCAFGR